jgi:hypothetical protein
MKEDILKNMEDVVKVQVETDRDSLKSALKDNKIVIVITKELKVITKMVKVAAYRKRAPRLTVADETYEAIKSFRKCCKDNIDATNVFVLIEKLSSSIKTLNLKDMTQEAVSMFNHEIRALITKLSSTQKLLLPKMPK